VRFVSTRRWITVLVTLALLPGLLPASAVSAAGMTIAGANAVNIRSCPQSDCDVIAVATRGNTMQATGEPENGFTPVTYDGISGYVASAFLFPAGQDTWFREGMAGCKRVALIFDIGVGFEPSTTIIDTLVSTGTPATMFPMGTFALNQPEYLKLLADAGFPIGTHGQEAVDLTKAGPSDVTWSLDTSAELIEAVIGHPIEPLYTPYAATIDANVRAAAISIGYLPVGWKVAAIDFNWTATGDSVYNDIMPNIYDGAIVEMHLDAPVTETSTAVALPRIIADLTAQGYTFVTVQDMMQPCPAG